MSGERPEVVGKLIGIGVMTGKSKLLPGWLPVDRALDDGDIKQLDRFFAKDAPHTLVEIREVLPK